MKKFPPMLIRVALALSFAVIGATLHAEEQEGDFKGELPRIAPVEPSDALETLVVAPGFKIELVAHELLVMDPIAMAFDEHGRLFVAEMRGYSEQADEDRGVIRLLTDDDGDGKFDRSTVYVDKLSWPTAICCYDGGVFVGVAPDILYCKDTDGDGEADVRQPIFTGFGKTNVQGLLNSFQWGIDNRIHGATSSSGGQVRKPHEPADMAISLRGRDFSFGPAALDLRPESGGGQHGMSFDRWGRKFVSSNSDHLQTIVIGDHYLARNPYYALASARESIAVDGPQAEVFRISPIEPWRIVRTRLRVAGTVPGPVEGGGRAGGYFTGATGATIYYGDAWPEEYRKDIYAIIGDVGSNIIHRKRVSSNGVSFLGKRIDDQHEFVASTDIWFRPAQFCNGPDGALYVADMYREVIEHPASLPPVIKKHLDLTSGRDRGRIYRIVPDDFTQPHRLLPGDATTAELVAMLGHLNGWHRLTASRLLQERKDESAVAPLQQLLSQSDSPLARHHALDALEGLNQLSSKAISAAMDDSHPRVREHAAFHAGRSAAKDSALRDKLISMIADEDPRIRFQVTLSLGGISEPLVASAYADLLIRDSGDPWVRAAVLSSCAHVVEPLVAQLETQTDWASTELGKSTLSQLHDIMERKQEDEGEALLATDFRPMTNYSIKPLQHAPIKNDVIRRYRQALDNPASAERGKAIFKKTCTACHDTISNQGGIAPSVASYRHRGVDFILTNVIDPNREVNPQYLSYSALTADGLTVTGMITAETATSITFTAGRDEKKTLLRIDIEELVSTGKSLMPEDIEKDINEQQMADLLAYLLSVE